MNKSPELKQISIIFFEICIFKIKQINFLNFLYCRTLNNKKHKQIHTLIDCKLFIFMSLTAKSTRILKMQKIS